MDNINNVLLLHEVAADAGFSREEFVAQICRYFAGICADMAEKKGSAGEVFLDVPINDLETDHGINIKFLITRASDETEH